MQKHYARLSFHCHRRPFSSGFLIVMLSCPIVQVYHGGFEVNFPLGDSSQTSPGFVLLVQVCSSLLAALGQSGVEAERHERLDIAM